MAHQHAFTHVHYFTHTHQHALPTEHQPQNQKSRNNFRAYVYYKECRNNPRPSARREFQTSVVKTADWPPSPADAHAAP